MFSFLTNALLVALLTGNLGGPNWYNQYSGDSARRVKKPKNVSEIERIHEDVWELWWQIDQPSHLTPVRVHGGIGP